MYTDLNTLSSTPPRAMRGLSAMQLATVELRGLEWAAEGLVWLTCARSTGGGFWAPAEARRLSVSRLRRAIRDARPIYPLACR